MKVDLLHAVLALCVLTMAFWGPSRDEIDTYVLDRIAAQCAAYHDDVTTLIMENARLAAQVRRLEETMRPLMQPVE